MALNRLTRDQLINRALDLADSAVLDVKDRPGGVVLATALSVAWLQEGLDYFTKQYPFSADIVSTAVTLNAAAPGSGPPFNNTIAVPADFVLDYPNGIVLDDDKGRMIRRGLGAIIKRSFAGPGTPRLYAVRGSTIQFWPKANVVYTGTLYYYSMPPLLVKDTIPIFPDDWVLTNYVWLKAQEWHRIIPIGTAIKFADTYIAKLQQAGIGSEAEEDQFDVDPTFAQEASVQFTDWMGKPNL